MSRLLSLAILIFLGLGWTSSFASSPDDLCLVNSLRSLVPARSAPAPSRPLEIPNFPYRETHLRSHLGWTDEQARYLDDILEIHSSGRMSTPRDVDFHLNNPVPGSSRTSQDLRARPFRRQRTTSLFPEGTTADDVLQAYARGEARVDSSREDVARYLVEVNGNRYQVNICRLPTCPSREGPVNSGDIVTTYPVCGPQIRAIVNLEQARQIFARGGTLTRESFIVNTPCPN